MQEDLRINEYTSIKGHELEISASRSGGPGGQHVNKTNSKITVRWNVAKSESLPPEQKEILLVKLAGELSSHGDLIISSSSSRSQLHNKNAALNQLADKIRQALIVPKKRRKTKISKEAQERRLQSKHKKSMIKKMRHNKSYE